VITSSRPDNADTRRVINATPAPQIPQLRWSADTLAARR
jgi:hypothetical protein